jgi:hypothetical protein
VGGRVKKYKAFATAVVGFNFVVEAETKSGAWEKAKNRVALWADETDECKNHEVVAVFEMPDAQA